MTHPDPAVPVHGNIAFDTVVMKFGGSSVADADKVRGVARRLVEAKERGLRVVGTVSAMGKTTDSLIALAHEVSPQPDGRELDMLLSTGERISCALVAMAIHDLGFEAVSFTGSQAGIVTDDAHGRAKIREIRAQRVLDALDAGKIVLVAGFQGVSTDTNDVTTLGRGGTDATAVALAAALGAACEIYSDVAGVYTSDPRVVPGARKLPRISYEEMLEMSASGAKVLMLRSVELARNHNVRVHSRSTFSQEEGTWIVPAEEVMEHPIISGVTHSESEVIFTLTGIPDRPGAAATVFDSVAAEHVNVDTIIQNVVHGVAELSFSVPHEDVPGTRRALAFAEQSLGPLQVEENDGMGKVSLIGAGMRSHPGRRGAHVPHARRPRHQPAHDLDLADQDQLHDRPRRGARPPCARCTTRSSSRRRRRWRSDVTRLAILGATGAVGSTLLRVLEERAFPLDELRLLASERSAGDVAPTRGREIDGAGRRPAAASTASTSRSSRPAPRARASGRRRPIAAGAVVVDNSSAFRMDDGVPLVVADVNPHAARAHAGLIANPNCSTMQLMPVLAALHRRSPLEHVTVATYQSVSGTGPEGDRRRCATQSAAVLAGEEPRAGVYAHRIAFNVLPFAGLARRATTATPTRS